MVDGRSLRHSAVRIHAGSRTFRVHAISASGRCAILAEANEFGSQVCIHAVFERAVTNLMIADGQ